MTIENSLRYIMKRNKILKIASLVLIAAIAIGLIIGCGEEEMENPVAVEGVVGMLSDLKTLDSAPGAPQLIPEGTPTVKSVGYYSDWKLTKPLSGIIPVGKTIFVKVKFSEKMKLVVADDKHARPILYRKIDGKRTRFNVANFGATGEDFVSGDAKPIKTKTSFVCKYVVQPEDGGNLFFALVSGALTWKVTSFLLSIRIRKNCGLENLCLLSNPLNITAIGS